MSFSGRKWTLACLSVLVVAAGACDGDMSVQEFGDALIGTVCDFEARCGGAPDRSSCLATIDHSAIDQVAALVKAGKVKYDPGLADACLADYRRSLSTCSLAAFTNDGDDQSCVIVFQGTVNEGGVCIHDLQCISGHCDRAACADTATCCAGTCTAGKVAIVPAAGDCTIEGSVCAAGTYCDHSVGTCQPRVGRGQPCAQFEACSNGTLCSVGLSQSNGTCIDPPPTGAACATGGFTCGDLDDYCGADAKCVPRVGVGASCANGEQCVGYAFCDATGHCVAHARVGESCAGGIGCIGGLECSPAGVCQIHAAGPVCQ